MAAGTSIITERSPYIARTSFTLAQSTVPMAEWAAKNGIKKVVTMVSDYAPGIDAENSFKEAFTKAGGEVARDRSAFRSPIPDFAPFLQRAADAKPDAIFVFVPSGQGGAFVKQFVERGLDKAGVKLIGPGDVTDDDLLNGMGDQVIGTVTAHFYSAAHPSATNKAFVEAFKKAAGFRPNFMAVGGYDGMHLIYEALKKTGGKADGDSLIAAMKGHEMGEPARPDLDRSRYPRHHPEHLHPQGREGRRRALQRRVRDHRSGQGSGQGREEVSRFGRSVSSGPRTRLSRPGPLLAGSMVLAPHVRVRSRPRCEPAFRPPTGVRLACKRALPRACAHLSHGPQSPFFVP